MIKRLVAVAVILIIGFGFYQFFKNKADEYNARQSAGSSEITTTPTQPSTVETPKVEANQEPEEKPVETTDIDTDMINSKTTASTA